MFQVTNFCGVSGQSYHFKNVEIGNGDWAGTPGTAIYTGDDGRVIAVVEQNGGAGDRKSEWALLEARRFGASRAFFRRQDDHINRTREASDLSKGLHPVCLTFDAGSQANDDRALPMAA